MHRSWTAEEEQAVRDAYMQIDQAPSTWFLERFPHRTPATVHAKAKKLGVTGYKARFNRPVPWSASETDWAYLAGIIDGEGSIQVDPQVIIVANNTDVELIQWLQRTFPGCRTYEREPQQERQLNGVWRRKRQYRVVWSSVHLMHYMFVHTLPYLIVKREKAERALARLDIFRTTGRRTASPSAQLNG